MKLAITLLIIVAALFVLNRSRRWSKRVREAGRIPAPGEGTDADVERLARHGRKMSAIKLYREIHDVDLTAAKTAVEAMLQEAGNGR